MVLSKSILIQALVCGLAVTTAMGKPLGGGRGGGGGMQDKWSFGSMMGGGSDAAPADAAAVDKPSSSARPERPEKVECSTDADCTGEGETCIESKRPLKEGKVAKSFCRVAPTPCASDDDCADLEGFSCVARPQKDDADVTTEPAQFFCRDPDAIRPFGKGRGGKKGGNKGKGKGGNKGKGKDSKPEKVECSTDADCTGEGETCIESKKALEEGEVAKSFCRAAKEPPASCSTDADCSEDETCVEAKAKFQVEGEATKMVCKGAKKKGGKGKGRGGNKGDADDEEDEEEGGKKGGKGKGRGGNKGDAEDEDEEEEGGKKGGKGKGRGGNKGDAEDEDEEEGGKKGGKGKGRGGNKGRGNKPE